MYDRPATLFAATFVGEPAMNVLPARIRTEGGKASIALGGSELDVDAHWLTRGSQLSPEKRYLAGFRPQQVSLAQADSGAEGTLNGRVFAVEAMGSRYVFDVEVASEAGAAIVRVMTSVDEARRYTQSIDAPIGIKIDFDFVYLFDADTGSTVRQANFTNQTVQ